MRNLLVINPNTSTSVTQLLHTHVQAAAGHRVRVHAATARFGAAYIDSEVSYAVAAHATLDVWAAWSGSASPPDAVLIGCFGDPGLFALRETCAVAVIGLAEASFALAARHRRFAVVTGGMRWRPILERLAWATGQDAALAGIHTIEPTGAELAADPAWARRLLTQACRDAVRQFNADAVVLGGAGLAGMAAAVQADVEVPVIDSVLAAAETALASLGV